MHRTNLNSQSHIIHLFFHSFKNNIVAFCARNSGKGAVIKQSEISLMELLPNWGDRQLKEEKV